MYILVFAFTLLPLFRGMNELQLTRNILMFGLFQSQRQSLPGIFDRFPTRGFGRGGRTLPSLDANVLSFASAGCLTYGTLFR